MTGLCWEFLAEVTLHLRSPPLRQVSALSLAASGLPHLSDAHLRAGDFRGASLCLGSIPGSIPAIPVLTQASPTPRTARVPRRSRHILELDRQTDTQTPMPFSPSRSGTPSLLPRIPYPTGHPRCCTRLPGPWLSAWSWRRRPERDLGRKACFWPLPKAAASSGPGLWFWVGARTLRLNPDPGVRAFVLGGPGAQESSSPHSIAGVWFGALVIAIRWGISIAGSSPGQLPVGVQVAATDFLHMPLALLEGLCDPSERRTLPGAC